MESKRVSETLEVSVATYKLENSGIYLITYSSRLTNLSSIRSIKSEIVTILLIDHILINVCPSIF